jgi:hypothetical protein
VGIVRRLPHVSLYKIDHLHLAWRIVKALNQAGTPCITLCDKCRFGEKTLVKFKVGRVIV